MSSNNLQIKSEIVLEVTPLELEPTSKLPQEHGPLSLDGLLGLIQPMAPSVFIGGLCSSDDLRSGFISAWVVTSRTFSPKRPGAARAESELGIAHA